MDKKKAVALMLAYTLLSGLMVAASAQMYAVTTEYSASYRTLNVEKSFWLAEAGLANARFAIMEEDWSGWSDVDGKKVKAETKGVGKFTVTVDPGTNSYALSSVGYVAGLAGSNTFTKTLTQTATISSPFKYAAFGKYSFTMTGSAKTDSYNSDDGEYNVGGNVGTNGDVGTDASVLTVTGTGYIDGDVNVAPGGVFDRPTYSGAEDSDFTSGTISKTSQENFEIAEVPETIKNSISEGKFKHSSPWPEKVKTISGTHHFEDFSISSDCELNITDGSVLYIAGDMKITGDSAVNILGNVTIYVDGNISVAGSGFVNVTQKPTDLIVYGTGTGTGPHRQSITVSGHADLYGAIYAPEADVKIPGSGKVFGSIIGGDIAMTGDGDVHYDEALGAIAPDDASYEFGSWSE